MKEWLDKVRNFCAYQERCHADLRHKCKSWGVNYNDTEQLIAAMIEEGYLNEERFARAFCRGKFLYNHWGKNKISYELKMKGISPFCIKQGMLELDALAYHETGLDMIKRYYSGLKGLSDYNKKSKSAKFMIGKGFEPDLVWKWIEQI